MPRSRQRHPDTGSGAQELHQVPHVLTIPRSSRLGGCRTRTWRWIFLLLITLAQVSIAEATTLEDQGKVLLTRLCARCHAVERAGRSPHVGAPPFRSIGDRYDINELTERMTERLVSTHPDMPDFQFSEENAKAVRAYLYSIQR
jgi:mono/diheme cytochrome c family protein